MYRDAIATPWGPGLCIIHFLSFFLSLQMNEILKVELQFILSQCALDVSIIVRNPEAHPIIFRVKTCYPPGLRFYLGKLYKKKQPHMAHVFFRVCFHHNKQYKKSKYSKQYCSHSSDSYQTKTWWRAERAEQLF